MGDDLISGISFGTLVVCYNFFLLIIIVGMYDFSLDWSVILIADL